MTGQRFFGIGLLLLPSSALLGGLCLLVAAVRGSWNRAFPIWRDRWCQPLLLAAVLMLIGATQAETGAMAWAGLGNWLPLIWAFWAFQPYLESEQQRRDAAWMLVAGTLPVLLTGFGQMLFGWEGPWRLGGEAVVWFVAPGGKPVGRLSGLFDYANVTAAWLAAVWPLILAAILRQDGRLRRGSAFLLGLSTVAAVLLTRSRNGLGALALAVPFVIGPAQWLWLAPLLLVLSLPVVLTVLPGVNADLQSWARNLLPVTVQQRLTEQQTTTSLTRLSQWQFGLTLIHQNPWLGWGASAFSVLYPLFAQRKWHGHSHNLPLELAISHGVPVALLMVGTVLALLVLAVRRGILHQAPLERAWWTSALVLVVLHATDLPYFDARLNLLGWVLLAGLIGFTRQPQPGSGPGRDAPAGVPASADP